MFERHKDKLEAAIQAIENRACWSAYPEIPSGKIYGESAKDDGAAAFRNRLDKPFELNQAWTCGTVGGEVSPYGLNLGITYPKPALDGLMAGAQSAMVAWGKASVETRVGVCLEILHRLNQQSFELANAVMHTTGQGFMMAFQAGGPHAQDRGLEAVAHAYREMTRCPQKTTWKKQVGKDAFVTLEKRYRVVPRGVAVVIGCSTFPTWNTYPGMFASLATGNPVIIKPHPGAILPLAITVETARDVLQEAGFDPNVVMLAADGADDPLTKALVTRAEVQIVDYTGGSEFGTWVEDNARHAQVYTEKAGVNSVILDSVDDLKAVTGNLAFSLSLYSGQMCTTPQNIFIPWDGIDVAGERVSFDDAVKALVGAIDWFLGDPGRATEVLGAIQNPATVARIEAASSDGEIVRPSAAVTNERFPDARVHSPVLIKTNADRQDLYMREMFGPIVYVVATDDTQHSIALAAATAESQGAITGAIYSTRADVLDSAADAMAHAGVALSCNLTGHIYVNQSAAFSDYHVSGANPAGNATLCDAAFVANRFRVVQRRDPV